MYIEIVHQRIHPKPTLNVFLQKQPQSTEEPVVKRSCRSDFTPFKFKDQCLICGDTCLTEVDPKNRKRWRRVVQCATADRGPNQDSFKKVMLDACDVRDDEWGHQVRIRVEGAVSDLQAADGQYHKDCMSLFRGPRNLKYSGSVKVEQAEDEAFTRVVNYLTEDRSRIYNSVELHEQYTLYQGEYLT